MSKLSFLFIFLFCIPTFAQFEEGTYELIVRKQQKKEDTRWSLAEWYETKNKIKLQDMWLALNSSDNPFEFFVGYESSNYDSTVNDNGSISRSSHRRESYSLDAFANIVGLHYEAFNTSDNISGWNAEFKIRVLGTSNQNTNLTVSYGQKNSEDKNPGALQTFSNETLGASFTFYLMKHFGLIANYTHMNSKTNSNSTDVSGYSYSYEAFIDYGLVRVFGGNKTSSQSYISATTTTVEDSTSHFGVKFFF